MIAAAWIVALIVLAAGVTHEGAIAGSLDDVFVVLHEARGWASHLGVLPQVLESDQLGRPSVEGSTSPADVMVKMATMVIAPSADPLVMAGWVCLGWLALGALAVAFGAAALGAGWIRSLVVAAGWACSLGLVEAASYRLEGPLFAAAWAALLVAGVRGHRRDALALAVVLCAVRPEGFVLGPAAALWAHRGSISPSILARCVSTIVPTLGGRLLLFGTWAPQSFFAKSSDSRLLELQDGIHYLDASLRTPAGIALVALGAAVLWCIWIGRSAEGDERSARSLRCGLIGLAALAAVILVASGGDGYAGSRLALPIATPVWLAAAIPTEKGARVQRGCLGLALSLQLFGLQSPAGEWPLQGDHAAEPERTAVERLQAGPSGMEVFEGDREILLAVAEGLDGETIAHRHAQRFRWLVPELKILDLTGLTSREIASLPAPNRITFGRDGIAYGIEVGVGALHIDVLRARPSPLASVSPLILADAELALRYAGAPPLQTDLAERLAERYVGASLRHPGAAGWFNLLVRRDLAERFASLGFRIGP